MFLPTSKNEHRPEIVDIRAGRPRREEIAAGMEGAPGVMAGKMIARLLD